MTDEQGSGAHPPINGRDRLNNMIAHRLGEIQADTHHIREKVDRLDDKHDGLEGRVRSLEQSRARIWGAVVVVKVFLASAVAWVLKQLGVW